MGPLAAGGDAGIDTSRLEALVIWVPPLLGAATVVVLFRFAQRLFGSAIAALAGLALCLSSAHFWYSQIGFVDHHAAVALAATVALGTGLVWLEESERGRRLVLGELESSEVGELEQSALGHEELEAVEEAEAPAPDAPEPPAEEAEEAAKGEAAG